ncbi:MULTISPECIES: PEP-CTERM sorting domain-containing protein [unclassified Nostoc]|uniref:PEP-CTERM sorting domain-containing protein n=1 Tax=unclassified Nostoc TaxID=2593658 RepID=UPI002AD2BAB0|nr:PEP-CTERM sorting domain-containing protein [Nostoc sp. DedQUE03]MDZ7971259.1 PEP-CTERM sorting domain-containing protein [Nostoc sp. DedQUE03]MDZ8043546.1 PEP-CTERM sorting domain-containing protein [Nostoc sp. DedQUE02]
MIGFKCRLLNATLAFTAAIPLATAGLFTSAGSAQAAALSGEIQFNGGFTVPSGSSQITFSQDALTFTPQPITPIAIVSSTGTFSAFNSGNIGNIISFSSKVAENPFIDFGSLTYPGFILPGENTTSLTDKLNTFTLTSSSYKLNQDGLNVGIGVALFGYFTSATGEISNGGGNLTFQVNNASVASVNSILSKGGSISNLSFSGGTFATVPEPATLLGLGIVGAGMAMSRRRKTVA